MKPGPVVAMVGLLFLGLWLVLQPALSRQQGDLQVRIGAVELLAERTDAGLYRFIAPPEVATGEELDADAFLAAVDAQREAWGARPAFERVLLGFFNITSWTNFAWVAVGLLGQAAFFGRMMIQWVVSENRRESQVPELFWWLSLFGGIALFTYFVWRVDVVGVLGQSSGVVVYARNLRLITKQRRRAQRERAVAQAAPTPTAPDSREAPSGAIHGCPPAGAGGD